MIGICLLPKFHNNRKWVYAGTWYLFEALKQIPHIIISSQEDYDKNKNDLTSIYLGHPGWGSPTIELDTNKKHLSCITLSDPHHSRLKAWFPQYVKRNNVTHILAHQYQGGLYHFPEFSDRSYKYFPWAVPDQFIQPVELKFQNKLHMYGATNHPAYVVRKWCEQFSFVEKHNNSGCKNKTMTDEEFYKWLFKFDVMVAAGSFDKRWSFAFPKYFEIPAAGCLLFAQKTPDLKLAGFNSNNCIMFDKMDFEYQAEKYLASPDEYLHIRLAGQALVAERHTISKRIRELKLLLKF